MARKQMSWFRFYVEAPSDRKVRRMRPEHRWVWVCVLCAARTSHTPGELWVAPGEPMLADDLADLAGVPVKTATAAVAHMVRLALVAGEDPWTVPSWDARQYESDSSTERVRAHRQRQRNNDETLQGRSSNGRRNAPDTETETDNYPLPPSSQASPVDNPRRRMPYDDRPAVDESILRLHTRLAAFNPEKS